MAVRVLIGDALARLRDLPAASVHCCVTSPPYYGLRDYGVDGQIGLEETPDAFVARLVEVFREVRRVLRDDGTLWLNIGDSYAGSWGAQGRTGQMADRSVVSARQIAAHPKKASRTGSIPSGSGLKQKDLIGIPWMLAFALRADGWYLRKDIIWHKPNPMPESVTDRPTSAHEHVFMLAKSERYFFDQEAVAEPAKYPGDNRASRTDTRKVVDPFCSDNGSRSRTGRPTADTVNIRDVWTIATRPYSEAHFATFPPDLPERCIKAGCPEGGTVLDPFFGAGTTGLVADRLGRDCIGIELNPEYAALAQRRIEADAGMFAKVDAA